MRDEPSQDRESDDLNKPPAGENELRISRVKGPNEMLENRGHIIYDEYVDPFSKVQARSDTYKANNDEDVSKSTQNSLNTVSNSDITDPKEYLDDITYFCNLE